MASKDDKERHCSPGASHFSEGEGDVLKVLCHTSLAPYCANPSASIHILSSVLKCIQYIKPVTLYPWLTTETGDW